MSNQGFNRDEIRAMRLSYGQNGIGELSPDPFLAFTDWLRQAHENPIIVEANAMVLSTVDSDLTITTRSVLLKDISQGGFTFFTNYSSRKAHSIEMNAQVSLLFPWYAMERQVSISGLAEKVSVETMVITDWCVGEPSICPTFITRRVGSEISGRL
jgi:pyridoxamine 5'-phosphate oxidase